MPTDVQHNFDRVRAQIGAEAIRIKKVPQRVAIEVGLQALADIQTLSPVRTGRYRASHDLTINAPSSFEVPEGAAFASVAEQRMQNAESILSSFDPKGASFDIFVATNLDYAQAIENGSSQQAPNGVYELARQRVENTLLKIVQREST